MTDASDNKATDAVPCCLTGNIGHDGYCDNGGRATLVERQNPRPLDCADCRRHAERYVNDCIRTMQQDVSEARREQMIIGSLKVLPAVHHYHDRFGRMEYV